MSGNDGSLEPRPVFRSGFRSGGIDMARMVILLLLGGLLTGGGCQGNPENGADGSEVDLAADNAHLQSKLAEQERHISELEKQLAVLRGFDNNKLVTLVRVTEMQLGRYTRCYDGDADGIDDGLVVYINLRDGQGDVMKAAGAVTIELWDLAEKSGSQQLGNWHIAGAELPGYWLGGPLADHYRFELQWQDEQKPRHVNLTIKARFEEALTGNSFEAQKMVSASLGRAEK